MNRKDHQDSNIYLNNYYKLKVINIHLPKKKDLL